MVQVFSCREALEAAMQAAQTAREAVMPPSPYAAFVPVYGVRLVQTDQLPWCGDGKESGYAERPVLTRPDMIVSLLEAHLSGADREHFAVVLLDIKNRLIGIHTVSIGDLTSSLAHPREVFKPALLANAASLLLFHNHPSGNPAPSPEDVAVTRRLSEAGCLLGIDVLDHVILGDKGRWVSLRQTGDYTPCSDASSENGSGNSRFTVRVQTLPGGPTVIGDTRDAARSLYQP